MTDKTQPEALRLADWLQAAVQTYPQMSEDEPGGYASEVDQIMDEAAEELRRQHARIAGLETELEAIGAGGVQALSAAPAVPAGWVERWHGSGGKEFWEGWSILNATNREMIAHLGPDVDPDAVRDIVAAHNEALCGECAGTGGRWCPACAGATPPAEQQAAPKAAHQQKAHHLTQALTDPENQPNQYGVEFGMSGQQMYFKIGNQLFRLAYEPDDQQEFEFMKRMLIHAFSTFTPDVKAAPVKACVCGELQAPGTVHRVDGPCYVAAPQQEPAAYIHVPHHTVEGQVRPVVSFEKYQQDYADGIYSTRIPLYTTPQPAPAPLSDDVVREPLTPEQIAEIIRETWGCASIAPRHAMGFARAIEAEVRKQDDALIQQLVEALKHFQYRACESIHPDFVDEAITAARARLGEKT